MLVVCPSRGLTIRTILLCMLAMFRGVHFFIEQPSGSLLPKVPHIVFLMNLLSDFVPIQMVRLPGTEVQRVHVGLMLAVITIQNMHANVLRVPSHMGLYGHFCPKLTMLMGTPQWAYTCISF